MARNDVRIDRLAAEIANAVRSYTEGVGEAIPGIVDDVAKECVEEIKANSPKRHGEYAKGWKVVKRDRHGVVNRVIWNPKHYRLVHLLEKGHAKRGGGRVSGRPHVAPAEQKYVEDLMTRITQVIRNGG